MDTDNDVSNVPECGRLQCIGGLEVARLDVPGRVDFDVHSGEVSTTSAVGLEERMPSTCTSVSVPDPTLLLPSPPDSCVEVVWGKSQPATTTKVVPRLDVYRNKFFEQPHDVFFGVGKDPMANGVHKHLVCCVKRNDENGQFEGLLIGDKGRFIETKFRVAKSEEVVGMVALLSEVRPNYVWSVVPSAALSLSKLHLLGLEARLGPRRNFSVGVVFGSQNQWKEQDMFETPLSSVHTEFLRSLGGELEDINLCAEKLRLTTNFLGFDINFHVAPLLTADERRQYIGNDKVIIFCLEESEKPFVPRFRGQVNSVGIVCQKKTGQNDSWKVALFHKDRVAELSDSEFSGNVLRLQELRKIVLTLAINGQHAVLSSPPFDGMIARVFQDQLSQMWTDLQPVAYPNNNESLHHSASTSKMHDGPKWLGLSIGKRASKRVEIPAAPSRTSEAFPRASEAFPGVKLFSDRNSLDDVRFASLRHGAKCVDSDSIFGKRLCDCPPIGQAVPWFVRECVRFLTTQQFILREGIFRIPGSSSGILRLQNTFTTSFVGQISDAEDPDVVASCFKAFFSCLADSVIPMSLWQSLVDVTDARYFNIDDALILVSELPPQNVEVLSFVIEFLQKVSECSSCNKMTVANLGMTFGYVLMRSPDDVAHNVGSSMPKEVCSFLIENWAAIFQRDALAHDMTDSGEISSTFEHSE